MLRNCHEGIGQVLNICVCSIQVANSDQLHVELLPHDQEGKLKASLTVCLNIYTVEAGLKLDDNRWHDIDLRFIDGLLQVQLDDERVSIANSSDFVTSPLFKRSEDVAAPIVLGQGYKGCLLEGPSVQFTTMNEDFLNNCPIPLIGNFSNQFQLLTKKNKSFMYIVSN